MRLSILLDHPLSQFDEPVTSWEKPGKRSLMKELWDTKSEARLEKDNYNPPS